MTKRKPTSLKPLFIVIALGAVGAGGWYYFNGHAGPAASAQRPGMPVEAQAVTVGPLDRAIDAIGSLQSNESVIVRPEIAGRISDIHFKEGQAVEKGDLLIKLDDAVTQAEVREAAASVKLSQANYDRARELFKKGAGTERARDEALAQMNTDQARLELAQAQLEKTELRAPFSGLLGLRQVSPGDYVNPGQDMVNLECIDPLKVDFRVAETTLGELRPGQTIQVMVDAFPGETFQGNVYAIDPRIDAAGRSILIRATIDNSDMKLRPGLFARVRLVVDHKDKAITVPEEAIIPKGNDKFVMKVVDGKGQMAQVHTGQRRRGMVEVTDGLAPDDTVITAGYMKVQPGSPVTVVPPKPAKAE